MTKHIALIALLAAIVFQSCDQSGDSLKAKQAALEKLKTQQKEIQGEIAVLESEIKKLDPTAVSNEKAKRIAIDTVAKSDFKHFIELQGSVDALENVMAIQQVPGIVTQILVKEGDRVSKGQVLYLTDATTYTRQMEVVETQLDLAKVAYEKQKKLWEQNIGSEIQYLQAKSGKETLEKQIANVRAAIEITKCKSPINGVVDEVRVKLGDMAAPSQLMPGVRVVNASNMVIKSKLSDSYIGKVRIGDKVMVNFPDINKNIESVVTYVSQTVDKQTRTFNVEARISNPSNDYKANMIARLMINDEVKKDVILIPQNVVQRSTSGEYVLVAENGKAVKKEIKTAESYDGKIIVTEGLKEGELLITTGFSEVVADQKIVY